jgi:cytochrome c biogenesis protein CcdA
MLRLVGLMISIGLVDSLNPSTIAPALYLASQDRPRARVIEFTLAVFFVYLVGGALIALGPGELIRSLVPHPHRTVRQIGEIVAGLLLVLGGGLLWRQRQRLIGRGLPKAGADRRSSLLLGASITAVELPTAFPYFAAIAAVLGSGFGAGRELGLLVLFNVCFVLPLLGIVVVLTLWPQRSLTLLKSARVFIERRWPQILAVLLMLVGVFAILLGATGFGAAARGGTGRFFRRVHGILHP